MDHDDTVYAELDRLLERATVSALTTLNVRVDVPRRLRELHDSSIPPATDDPEEAGGAVP
jgi:hypothetical protein